MCGVCWASLGGIQSGGWWPLILSIIVGLSIGAALIILFKIYTEASYMAGRIAGKMELLKDLNDAVPTPVKEKVFKEKMENERRTRGTRTY